MKHTLVIASRELREKSRILIAAAATSVLPFVALISQDSRRDALAVASALYALVAALGVAIVFGASTIAGDLVLRRLSFYFTKPISPASLWFGKAIAALLTSFFCFAVIVGVSAPFAGKAFGTVWNAQGLGLVALGIVVTFLVSHTVSTMMRSRSGIIGIDFVLAIAASLAIFFIIRPLFFGGAQQAMTLAIVIGAAIVVLLFVAPVWQLAQGRSDIRRSHAALSRAVWTGVAVILLGAGAYAAWVVNVDPADLSTYRIIQSPDGKRVFLSGVSPQRGDYQASFLIDVNNGRSERIAALPFWGEEFSRSGNAVAWLAPVWRGFERIGGEIYTKRLDQPDAPARETGIVGGRAFSLSPDGSRLAVLSRDNLSLHEVATQRLLASVHCDVPPMNAVAMFFTSNDVVRIYEWPYRKGKLEILELDARTKSLVKTGQSDADPQSEGVRASADGSRIVIPREGIVADGRTGATIAKLPMTAKGRYHAAVMSDGTIAMIGSGQQGKLSLFAPDGTLRAQVPLPTYSQAIAGELEVGKLIVLGAERPQGGRRGRSSTFVVDAARGTIERTLSGLRGALPSADSRIEYLRANERIAGVNDDGALVTWNVRTGEIARLGR